MTARLASSLAFIGALLLVCAVVAFIWLAWWVGLAAVVAALTLGWISSQLEPAPDNVRQLHEVKP